MSDSKAAFFRQSAWLATATVVSGAFMTLVHPFAAELKDEYARLGTMLRVFLLLAIPSAGLQVLFAQQAAASHTPEAGRRLRGAVRGTLGAITLLWLGFVVLAVVFRSRINAALNLGDSLILWPTLGAAWVSLTLPVFRGLLQGREQFGPYGVAAILDGVCRVVGIAVAVVVLHGRATAAMSAALAAMLIGTAVSAWAARAAWLGPGEGFDWRPLVRKAAPFTLTAGCLLTLSQADLIFLQAAIPAELTGLFRLSESYYPASQIGFALTQFTVPIALVMFPKIARSVARAEKTDALALALTGTLGLGSLAALAATLLPELPLRILYFRTPANWAAAPLVPWCAWAMLAFALANVLVSQLLARADFRIVPWVLGFTAVFLLVLAGLKPRLPGLEPMAAYRLVIGTVGGFNLVLLVTAAFITWRPRAAPAG